MLSQAPAKIHECVAVMFYMLLLEFELIIGY